MNEDESENPMGWVALIGVVIGIFIAYLAHEESRSKVLSACIISPETAYCQKLLKEEGK